MLGIRLASGRTIWTPINGKPLAAGQQSELDGEASILNLELRRLREGGVPPGP